MGKKSVFYKLLFYYFFKVEKKICNLDPVLVFFI